MQHEIEQQTVIDNLIEIENLHVDFSTNNGLLHALRGVSLNLRRGELLGIVGESGSGKSVTAHSILQLLPGNGIIQQGDIRYNGRSLLSSPNQSDQKRPKRSAPKRSGHSLGISSPLLRELRGGEIGIIFQEPGRSFDPIYPIGKAMAESIAAHAPNLNDREIRERSLRLLTEVNIPNPQDRLINFPHQFSGGLLQRIMIAMALCAQPKVLIADEPTTALDVTIQAEIVGLLLRLKRQRDLSIIFITHNLALISSIADRIVVMYAGLTLEEGPSRQIVEHPRHPYTRALLDSIPILGLHHRSRRLRAIAGTIPNPYDPEPGCPFEPRCPLARPECRSAIPAIRDEATRHRCILPGEKELSSA